MTDFLPTRAAKRGVVVRHAYALYRASRRQLDRIPPLKRAIRFAAEIKNMILDNSDRARVQMDLRFGSRMDPYGFARDVEQVRFRRAAQMLDCIRTGGRFQRAVEIGCAEGMFTVQLAEKCDSLLAVDISQVALERARERCLSARNIEFRQWDLCREQLQENHYDLIVAVGVLEYLTRPGNLRKGRNRLVEALHPGGYLLIGTTIQDSEIENSWVARWLIRGAMINAFVGKHPCLESVAAEKDECARPFLHSLFQKRSAEKMPACCSSASAVP